jgi:ketosteroid isomerase-like protein
MKRLLIAAALALMPVTAAAQATYKAPPPAEQALLALEQRWVTAFKASDGAAVDALLAANFVSIDADGSMRTKAELVERTTKGKWTSATLTEMKVVMHGKDTAVVTGVWAGVGTDGSGKAVDARERWADTWVKADGKWRCVASASAPLVTPAPATAQ